MKKEDIGIAFPFSRHLNDCFFDEDGKRLIGFKAASDIGSFGVRSIEVLFYSITVSWFLRSDSNSLGLVKYIEVCVQKILTSS